MGDLRLSAEPDKIRRLTQGLVENGRYDIQYLQFSFSIIFLKDVGTQ